MTEVILAILGRPQTAPSVLDAAERLCVLNGQAKLIILATGMPVQHRPLAAEALIAEAAYDPELDELDRKRMAALSGNAGGRQRR